MEKSIKEKAFSGIVWSGIDRFAQQLVAMAVRMVLARMILPDQFGLVGLLMSFMLVAGLLQDSGFFTAMVRRKDPSASDFSTIFYFNVGISTLLYVIFFFGAPLIADFWNQPMLTPLARVLFLQDGRVYHQLYRGNMDRENFRGHIADTLTLLADDMTGGQDIA